MIGEEELATESRLKDFERDLDNLINSIGITFTKDEVATEALNLTYEQLKKMHYQEALILNYKLHQYGLYILSLYNRAENIKNWANHNLNVVVGKEGHNYGSTYTKFEERRVMVIAGNSFAKALSDIYLRSSAIATELNGLSLKIEKIAYSLFELSKKREQNG